MAKDREGKFHPRKGKPLGSLKANTPGIKPISSTSYEEHLAIADKYTVGEEQPAPHLRLRHPNRNPDKRELRQQDRSEIKTTNLKAGTKSDEIIKTPRSANILVLSKESFAELAGFQASCCASVYLSTHRSGVDVNEKMDLTAFKSALQKLSAMLRQRNIDQVQIDRMLKPGLDLIRDDKMWLEMDLGLDVFISDGFFKYIKMPVAPKEEILVNTSFYVTPLLPIMTNTDYFYLLVLSKKQATLYRADSFGMKRIQVDEMPRGVDDVVHFEEKVDQKLWRTGSSGGGSGANYHGIGAGKPDDKENLALYFDEVDETLCKGPLNKENVPLLLSGVEYLIPIYKAVAKYKPIWEEALTGSHEHDDINSLYDEARRIMDPYLQERHEKALKAYWNQSATGLTSSIPDDVIPAAHYKQVWHLFVQKDQHIWGTFDELNNKLTIHETPS